MDLPEERNHSFIVRIRLEEPATRGTRPLWRGQVTHVPSGTELRFSMLDELADFIESYLSITGAEPGIS